MSNPDWNLEPSEPTDYCPQCDEQIPCGNSCDSVDDNDD